MFRKLRKITTQNYYTECSEITKNYYSVLLFSITIQNYYPECSKITQNYYSKLLLRMFKTYSVFKTSPLLVLIGLDFKKGIPKIQH